MGPWNARQTLERADYIRRKLKEQHGCCAICPRKLTVRSSRIDHVHGLECCTSPNGCKKCRRGVLCSGCNTGLGHFGDSIRLLAGAIVYLQDWDLKLDIEEIHSG